VLGGKFRFRPSGSFLSRRKKGDELDAYLLGWRERFEIHPAQQIFKRIETSGRGFRRKRENLDVSAEANAFAESL